MSEYKKLAEHTRKVVDRKARAWAKESGKPVAECRESIASRIQRFESRSTGGTGHSSIST